MKTFSMFKVLPLVAAGAALLGSGAADALTLTLFDAAANSGAGYTLTVSDGGINDQDPLTGKVYWKGGLGHGSTFSINVTAGTSLLSKAPSLDLNSVDVSTKGAGTLVITLWDTYTPPFPTYNPVVAFRTQAAGTTSNGTAAFAFSQFAAGTAPGGTGTPSLGTTHSFGTGSFGNSQGGSFDLAIRTTLVNAGRGITSFDANITPVPIPAAALLFGSALLGMAGVGRRKVAQG